MYVVERGAFGPDKIDGFESCCGTTRLAVRVRTAVGPQLDRNRTATGLQALRTAKLMRFEPIYFLLLKTRRNK